MKESTTQKAYEALREMIASRELQPGQQIVEMTIAGKLGISRTPVREAIRRLQEDGLVEIIHNRGAFLRHMSKNDVVMGYEMGEALEGMVAYLMAERCGRGELTQEEKTFFQQHLEAMDGYLRANEIKQWVSGDQEFHLQMAKRSGNHYLLQAYMKNIQQLNHVLWLLTPTDIDKVESQRQHHAIWDAVLEGDPEKARTAAQVHRHRIRDYMQKML